MRPPSLAEIAAAVAEEFGITPNAIRQKSNMSEVVAPRRIAYVLSREVRGVVGARYSMRRIGQFYAGKHYTSIQYGIKIGLEQMRIPEVAVRVDKIRIRLAEREKQDPSPLGISNLALAERLDRIEALLERRAM
jgi:predicted DNA repair protein MutK